MSSKRYKKLLEKIDKTKVYSFDEGINLIKQSSSAKFDESVEVHARLGIDPKKTDQIVRGTANLPFGTGKAKRVACFVEGEKEKEAKDAGADIVGSQDLIDKIKQTGICDFDVSIATPDMMKRLAPIAKILGPKGLMPSPKTETVTMDIAKIVKALKGGKISFRSDDSGNIHQVIGKVSFDTSKLKENFLAFIEALKASKPEASRGEFIRAIYLTSTMGPSIKIKI